MPSRFRLSALSLALAAAFSTAAGAVNHVWLAGNFGPGVAPSPLTSPDTLTIDAGGAKTFSSVSFTNAATVTWNADNLGFTASSVSNTGLWDATSDNAFVYVGGSAAAFTNSGTFRKSGGTGATTIGNTNVAFTNSGVLDAATGSIVFLGNNATFNDGSSFQGAGVVDIASSATFSGTMSSQNLRFSAGTFSGVGVGGATLSGTNRWTGGSFSGTWGVAADQTLTALNGGDKNFSSTNFTNAGTIVWDTEDRLGFTASAVTNAGVLDLRQNANLNYIGGSGSAFVNAGTLRKSGADGTSTLTSGNIAFTNAADATIDVQAGTLDFAGGAATFQTGTQFIGDGIARISSNATFNGAFTSANLVLAGGTFHGGPAQMNGTVQWTGGQFSGNWEVMSGQTLDATGAADKNFASTNFTNSGTLNWKTAARAGFTASTVVNAGLWDVETDADFSYIGGSGAAFTNTGTLRKSAGNAATLFNPNIAFVNAATGVIDVQTGSVEFAGGTTTFQSGTRFIGSGVARVTHNATFNGSFTSANLELAAGNFQGGSAELNGTVQWTGGQFTGNWQVMSGQTLDATGDNDKNFASTNFTNSGTVNWKTADRAGFTASTVVNAGLWDVETDADFSYIGGSGAAFTNTGTLRKSAGDAATVFSPNIAFVNEATGVIDVQTGSVEFAGGTTTFQSGTQFIGSGVARVTHNATFNGSFTSANLVLAAGNFQGGNAELNGTVQWTGGQFTGNWEVMSGQTLDATGDNDKNFASTNFTNSGTLNWKTAARAGFTASTVVNAGLWDVETDADFSYIGGSGAAFINTGTLRKSGGDAATVFNPNVAFVNEATGVIDVQTGSVEFAGGTTTFQSGTQFIGSGVARVTHNATFNGSFTSANLELAAGNFQGGSAELNGTVQWTGGQFTGNWQVMSGQTLDATGDNDKNFASTNFTNSGTLNWKTADRAGFTASSVTNAGLWDVQTDADFAYIGGSGAAFTNTGTLRKSGDGVTSIGANITFTNPGTIEVLAGTLLLPANFTNAGTLTGDGIAQSTTLTNSGVLKPGEGVGTLTIAGHLVQGAGSVTEFEIGGIVDHDVLAVTGNATLGGSIVVRRVGDFMPTLGDSFLVMTFANRVGSSGFLDDLTVVGWGGGVTFDVVYGAGTVSLEVTAVPEPATVALMAGGLVALGWAARRRRNV